MADLMIGILAAKTPDVGVLKSGSLTIKPTYKEHKSGFPQLTDIKVPEVITASFKLDCEEVAIAGPLLGSAIDALTNGSPLTQAVSAVAPTAQGAGFGITANGFIKGGSLTGTEGDFGTCTIEIDCIPMGSGGGALVQFTGATGAGPVIAVPNYDNQGLTKNKDNLAFGSPTVNSEKCKTATFTASSNFKFHTSGYPPVIDLAIMESCDLSISGEFQDPSAVLLTDALEALSPGGQPVIKSVGMSVPCIGGDLITYTLANAMIEPDLSFSPGNDWNGVTVKCTAMLAAGAKKLAFSA